MIVQNNIKQIYTIGLAAAAAVAVAAAAAAVAVAVAAVAAVAAAWKAFNRPCLTSAAHLLDVLGRQLQI